MVAEAVVQPARQLARRPRKSRFLKGSRAFARRMRLKTSLRLADMFLDESMVVDPDGNATRGKAAVVAMYSAAFKESADLKLESDIADIRFLTLISLASKGRRLSTTKGDASEFTSFTTLLARRDGKWRIAEIHEYAAPAEDVTPYERLKELEWMVGDWVDESDSVKSISSVRWADNQSYLIRTYSIEVQGEKPSTGTMFIGWDPQSGQIKSWLFNSEGGHGDGLWTRTGEKEWVTKATGVLRDGRPTSATQIHVMINKDSVKVSSIDRIIGGVVAPDISDVVMVRKPPQPGGAAAKPIGAAEAPSDPDPYLFRPRSREDFHHASLLDHRTDCLADCAWFDGIGARPAAWRQGDEWAVVVVAAGPTVDGRYDPSLHAGEPAGDESPRRQHGRRHGGRNDSPGRWRRRRHDSSRRWCRRYARRWWRLSSRWRRWRDSRRRGRRTSSRQRWWWQSRRQWRRPSSRRWWWWHSRRRWRRPSSRRRWWRDSRRRWWRDSRRRWRRTSSRRRWWRDSRRRRRWTSSRRRWWWHSRRRWRRTFVPAAVVVAFPAAAVAGSSSRRRRRRYSWRRRRGLRPGGGGGGIPGGGGGGLRPGSGGGDFVPAAVVCIPGGGGDFVPAAVGRLVAAVFAPAAVAVVVPAVAGLWCLVVAAIALASETGPVRAISARVTSARVTPRIILAAAVPGEVVGITPTGIRMLLIIISHMSIIRL